jgi:hypothetical protein
VDSIDGQHKVSGGRLLTSPYFPGGAPDGGAPPVAFGAPVVAVRSFTTYLQRDKDRRAGLRELSQLTQEFGRV